MITRSAIKKGFANECEVAKPLSHVTKKRKSQTKLKINNQTPIKINTDVHNGETNEGNVQSPVFNIHVHMPPTLTGNLNKSGQYQPVIHLHFGELISKFSSGAPLDNVETNNNNNNNNMSKGAAPSEVNCDSEKKSNSKQSKLSRPLKRNRICKKLNFSRFKESSENLKTENSRKVVQSLSETQENKGFARKSLSKKQLPVRRSVRQANNRKLLQLLEDFSENKSIRNKVKKKISGRNRKIGKNPVSIGETLNLKEPLLLLQDVMKVKENKTINSCNFDVDDKQEDCFRPVDASTDDGPENVEIHPVNVLDKGAYEQNLGENKEDEKNEKNLKEDLDDENLISICKKVGDVYSLVYSSDNETNSANDFADKCTFSKDVEMNIGNEVEPEKGFNKTSLDDAVKDTENNASLPVEKHEITAVQENGFCSSPSKGKDSSVNFEHSDTDTKSKDSSSESELSKTANFEEDNDLTDSPKELDKEEVNNLECKNDNLAENVVEENSLSFSEANSYKEMNINTLNFQLDLIKKEMKKRDMTVKTKSSRKKKKTELQITKQVAEKSPAAEKAKLPEKPTKKRPASKKFEKTSSAEDYIPLQVSGPTKFAVAQLSKIKPFNGHKAKNFRNEMLFGHRIKRYSDPKQREVYLLKKKAAEKRFQ